MNLNTSKVVAKLKQTRKNLKTEFHREQKQITSAIRALTALDGGTVQSVHTMSRAARMKIGAAQKARWAKLRKKS